MGTIFQSARTLARSAKFTVPAILTLGLGTAAVAFVAILTETVLLKRMPGLTEPDRIVQLIGFSKSSPKADIPFSGQQFGAWKANLVGFSTLSTYYSDGRSLDINDNHDWQWGAVIGEDFFSTLGAQPALGRSYGKEDHSGTLPNSIIIGHDIWRKYYQSSPSVIGQQVFVGKKRHPLTIIGVMPKDFAFPMRAAYWMPLMTGDPMLNDSSQKYLSLVGRMSPTATVKTVNAEVQTLASNTSQRELFISLDTQVRVTTLHDREIEPYKDQIHHFQLAAIVVFVLCSFNVAGLQFVRGTTKLQQTAIRAALGATRWQLIKDPLSESFLLLLVSLVLGISFAVATIPSVIAELSPEAISPPWWHFEFGSSALLLTLGATAFVTLVTSLVPAWQCSSPELSDRLRGAANSQSAPPASVFARKVTVVLQVSAATSLLIVGFIAARSILQLQATDLGVNPKGVLQVGVNILADISPDKKAEYYHTLFTRLESLPQVDSVAAGFGLPGQGSGRQATVTLDGTDETTALRGIETRLATAGLISTLQIRLLRGRDFDQNRPTADEVLIDQSFAQLAFGGNDPIGHRIAVRTPQQANARLLTVVGVVAPTKANVWSKRSAPAIYLRLESQPQQPFFSIFLRTNGAPSDVLDSTISIVKQVEQKTSIFLSNQGSYKMQVDASFRDQLIYGKVMGSLAIIAFAISAVGLYALISYTVAQRNREISIRLALGASPRDIVLKVLTEGSKLIATGTLLGIFGGIAASNAAASRLPNVTPTDPVAWIISAGLVAITCLFACWIPARRAFAVNPNAIFQDA